MYVYRSPYSRYYSPSLLRKLSQTTPRRTGSHTCTASAVSYDSFSRSVRDGPQTLTTRFERSQDHGRTRRRSSTGEYRKETSQRLLSQWSSSGSDESLRSARSDRMSLDSSRDSNRDSKRDSNRVSNREVRRRPSGNNTNSRKSQYSRSSYQDSFEPKRERTDSGSAKFSTRRFSTSSRVSTEPIRKESSSTYTPSRPVKKKSASCDKCDGKDHATDDCPYYKKAREDHPDAQPGKPKSLSTSGGNLIVDKAKVVSMPADGDCLFHSLAHGLGGTNATRLRREIATFIGNNPDLEIADVPLKEWVSWDAKSTIRDYARKMSIRGWGGGIEMAAFAQLKRRDVHVFERQGNNRRFKRISCFDAPATGSKRGATINVLYCGSCHYNYLDLSESTSTTRSSVRPRSYARSYRN